jgi:predicted house-cleaning NTP pyrophosphatase (Maf/HAM1 superfamily)
MTQDEIIEMARQVYGDTGWTESSIIRVEAFAKLVEEKATEKANARANASWILMCEKMVAFEREACAKVADGFIGADPIADAIRARGDKQ